MPKALQQHWEPNVIQHYDLLQTQTTIPKEAALVTVSPDGVILAMKPEKTAQNPAMKGSRKWREASCGTISFFDKEGERLCTYQYSRMPEHKKKMLKTLLKKHIEHILKQRPELKVICLADGSRNNWIFFDEDMPVGFQLVDFYHACEYPKAGLNEAYKNNPSKAHERYAHFKEILVKDRWC